MAELLRMPEVAANTPTATLSDWLVEENRPYASADALATIETDKAVVDLTAEGDGVVLRYLAEPGTEVRVGDPIAVIGQPGEPASDIDAVVASLAATGPGPEEASDPSPAPRPTTGPTPGTSPDPAPASAVASSEPAVPSSEAASSSEAAPSPEAAPSSSEAGGRVFASPLARRLAKEAGLPTGSITGTGPHGRIVRRDVELALATRERDRARQPAPRPAPAASPAPAAPFTDQPHTRMRRAIAQRLTESQQLVPHFYLRATVRVDRLLDLRTEVNLVAPVRISVNDFVIKAVAHAHRAVPAMNAVWTPDATRVFSTVDLGVAVATATGLVSPVIRDVEHLSIAGVAEASRDLAERARAGQLRQHELEGGASTVTNLGMYGTEELAAIINPPQSSILAVGAARPEPLATAEGTVGVGSVLRLTLSVDHRVVDGAVAAQWMRALVDTLQAPLGILL